MVVRFLRWTPLADRLRTFRDHSLSTSTILLSPSFSQIWQHTRTDTTAKRNWYTAGVWAFKFSQPVTMSSACCMDVINGGSLRVRNSNCVGSGPYDYCKAKEVRACPSVMSPETKRLLPPNTETVQTKPFPIRGRRIALTWALRASFFSSSRYSSRLLLRWAFDNK